MPVVFIHGVNVCNNAEYQQGIKRRDGCLRKIVAPALGMKAKTLKIFTPYWGDLGAVFA